ncbi:YjcZ family sporulation protein [Alkalihalobacillus clausii]|nr:YjcZ family sporulation protein [Shouchella clausii]MCR1289838.1 YjcZ family sporulation protein [Shouchella clausii]
MLFILLVIVGSAYVY